MSRPDWVKCIAHPHVDRRDSWCGQPLEAFHFLSADHAAINGEQQGRLVACRDCTDLITAALTEGQSHD